MNKVIFEQKKAKVNDFEQKLKTAKSVLVFEYLGLTAKETTELRRKLHTENASLYVLKNNILNRAITASNLKGFAQLSGPNAIIIAEGNEIISFKLINEIVKTRSFVNFKGGLIDGTLISKEQLSTIATIPSREGLYGMLLSCLQAPIRNFLYGLKAISATRN